MIRIKVLAVLVLVTMVTQLSWAEERISLNVENELDRMNLMKDLHLVDNGFSDYALESVAKQLQGEIRKVGADFLVVLVEGGEVVKLIVDAETLIFLNGEKSSIDFIEPKDTIFAYYTEEAGLVKGDWLDITR